MSQIGWVRDRECLLNGFHGWFTDSNFFLGWKDRLRRPCWSRGCATSSRSRPVQPCPKHAAAGYEVSKWRWLQYSFLRFSRSLFLLCFLLPSSSLTMSLDERDYQYVEDTICSFAETARPPSSAPLAVVPHACFLSRRPHFLRSSSWH
jgi:hypothetical protein